MRILLDTSYLYDLMETRGRFSDNERRFLSEQEAQLFVSSVSIWEMRLKYRAHHPSGQRKSPFNPNDVVAMVRGLNLTILPMTIQHAAGELDSPIPHRDPFDELLLVQAQEENLRLLTTDRRLIGHPLALTT